MPERATALLLLGGIVEMPWQLTAVALTGRIEGQRKGTFSCHVGDAVTDDRASGIVEAYFLQLRTLVIDCAARVDSGEAMTVPRSGRDVVKRDKQRQAECYMVSILCAPPLARADQAPGAG